MDIRSIYSLGTFIMKGVEIVCGFWCKIIIIIFFIFFSFSFFFCGEEYLELPMSKDFLCTLESLAWWHIACNPNMQEAEAEGSLASDQTGLHSEIMSGDVYTYIYTSL